MIGLVNVRAARSHELEEVIDLIGTAFAYDAGGAYRPEIGQWQRTLFAALYEHIEVEPEWLRVAAVDGRIASVAGVLPRLFYIGPAPVLGATLAPVATLPGHRRRGLAAACIADAFAYLRWLGFPLVYVLGDPRYYARFGCVPVFPRYRTVLTREQAAALSGGPAVRPFAEHDFAPVRQLYGETVERLPFWRDRGDLHWSWQRRQPYEGAPPAWLVTEGAGRITGYAIVEQRMEELAIVECCVENQEATTALLSACGRLAQERGTTMISLDGPLGLPAVRYAFDLGTEHRILRPVAQMLRIVDVAALMRALRPALRERLSRSELAGWQQRLTLRTEETAITLEGDGIFIQVTTAGSEEAVSLPLAVLTTLVSGYRPLSELLSVFRLRLEPATQRLLEVFFPRSEPFLFSRDLLF